MLEKVEKIFAKFGVTMEQVYQRLVSIGYAGYIQSLKNPQKKVLSHPLFFAMVSLLLKDVKNILEMGTGAGTGTNRFLKLFPTATIYTFELPEGDPGFRKGSWKGKHSGNPDDVARLKRNLTNDRIISVACNTFFLPTLDFLKKVEFFDLIFVDAGHDYPTVASDISYAYGHIRKGGFLFMDNYNIVKPDGSTYTIDYLKNRIKEEVLFFPLYLSPPEYVDLQRMVLLVKE